MKVYVINGSPLALARPRFAYNQVYDSQKSEKLSAKITLQNQHDQLPAYTGPLHIDVTFFMPIPKSLIKKKLSGKPHTYKPDIDNCIKYIFDTATSAGLWKDDCLIASVEAIKIYNEHPRTEFTVRSV